MTDSLATLLAAVMEDAQGAPVPPIVQSSLFTFDSYAAFEDRMAGRSDTALYTRVQNPTVAAFEGMMARAEGGEAAVGFASGIAAITGAILSVVGPGDRILCCEHVYPDTYRFLERMLRPLGIETTYAHPEALAGDGSLHEGVRLVYLESPSSVVFQTCDLGRVAALARAAGAVTMIDNSWATPVHQRPIGLGIDMVVHSASKYISGHSDTVAGVAVGSAERIDAIRDLTLPLLGAKLAPFEAFLLTRGLRTLTARMAHHERSANLFVDRLAGLPQVARVNSPGPNEVPGLTGRSGLMSVEFDDTIDIPALCDALSIFRMGVSWGGFESLILPARVGLAQKGEKNSMQAFGVSPQLVRISLGLEDPEDLWADFASALSNAAA